MRLIRFITSVTLAACLVLPAVHAQDAGGESPRFELVEGFVQKRLNGILSLMGLTVVPDVTTSSLSIKNGPSGDPDVMMSQLGAGATLSDSFPVYVEGMLSWSRYDPTFLVTNGEERRRLPLRWNSVSAAFGVGWDFALTDELILRPILTGSYSYIARDAKILEVLLNDEFDAELSWVRHGSMHAVGYGAAVMLDYQRYKPDYEIDVELRYSFMRMENFGGDRLNDASVDVETLNLWARLRMPISDWRLFGNPVRSLLELTHSEFIGDQRGVLGFDRLTSLGAGVEIQPDWLIDRVRMVGRYGFGENVEGFSVGFAVTF